MVSVCSILCLIIAILSVAGRVFTKAVVARRLSNDDYTILGAIVRATSHPAVELAEPLSLDLERRTNWSYFVRLGQWTGTTVEWLTKVAKTFFRND